MGTILDFSSQKTTRALNCVSWESRYDGALDVALIDSIPVAGISGPWPDGSYALIWWPSQELEIVPGLEFYASMQLARRRVEDMACASSSAACSA